MDANFTSKVQAWLDTPANERDNALGALYFLQLSNNQIMYRNIMFNPDARADVIEHEVRKYMKFRLAQVTHDEVEAMKKQVAVIVEEHRLDSIAESSESSESSENSDTFKSCKRADHDSLPAEIQALYVENASIMQKMRQLHLMLRNQSVMNATCPDSERYPFLKELIQFDKQYHHNWEVYDNYDPAKASEYAEQKIEEDNRMLERSIYRQINLTKGRYKKALAADKPTDSLKQQITDLYAQLSNPKESLTAELKELGIIA